MTLKELIKGPNEVSASESLWAEHGLTGLVLFSLFILVAYYARSTTRQGRDHRSDIREILDDAREERREVMKSHSDNTDKLATALDTLTDELRREKSR